MRGYVCVYVGACALWRARVGACVDECGGVGVCLVRVTVLVRVLERGLACVVACA